MRARWLGIGALGSLTGACLYVARLARQAGDAQAVWFFAAFSLLFALPLGLLLLRTAGDGIPACRRLYDKLSGGPEPAGVRFVPHWFMMSMLLVMGLSLLTLVVRMIAALVRGWR